MPALGLVDVGESTQRRSDVEAVTIAEDSGHGDGTGELLEVSGGLIVGHVVDHDEGVSRSVNLMAGSGDRDDHEALLATRAARLADMQCFARSDGGYVRIMSESLPPPPSVPAGWLVDPEDSTRYRCRDGSAWTEQRVRRQVRHMVFGL